ncbi:DUF86 domain-containing protein [Synechococcus lacustris]|uniref:type VII toxin-antitoxin system HepT family RNase toxin n=1 Tax=Synechococcus lacustris TaxID=2116544 RepID=UPI00333F0CD6
MSPLKKVVLERKYEHLLELLDLLSAEANTSLDEFLIDRRQQLLVERLLHLSIEAASDLLQHLLVQSFQSKPQTYADTFLLAGQKGLISISLAQRLVPAAGLRNRLVHDYEAIDPSRIHAAMAIAGRDLGELSEELAPLVRQFICRLEQ